MIDTALIETLSVLVGVSTVVVGVVLGLRELGEMKRQRSREFFDAVYRKFTEDRDFLSRRLDMLDWSWEDFDDFRKKYVGATNLESYVTCWQVWTWYDSLGAMLQSGMAGGIETDPIFAYNVLLFWRKFGPVILEWRKRSTSLLWKHYFLHNFEWLAQQCEKREKVIIEALPKK